MAAVIMEAPPSFDRESGQFVHQLLGVYAAKGERPPNTVVYDDVVALLRAFPYSGRRRPGPQRVASLTKIGLSLMPPIEWTSLGGETATDPGRLDMLWQAPRNFAPAPLGVVIDEWKAGAMPSLLGRDEVTDQIRRYVGFGVRTFGDRFKGVRLVALSSPSSSVFYMPDGVGVVGQPLLDTDFWFGPRPGEVI